MRHKSLHLILGDQLNAAHSWFKSPSDDKLFVIAELHQEANYTKHHLQKIAAFFLAMQNFGKALEQAGFHVLHLTLNDTQGQSLEELITKLCAQYQVEEFHYQQPDEIRLFKQLEDLQLSDAQIICWESEHFLVPYHQLADYFKPGKKHRLEHFYRMMRLRHNYLMQSPSEPLGGQWNYDANNRAKLKAADIADIPEPLCFANDVTDILARIKAHNIATIGDCPKQIAWPVNRSQSKELLTYFCQHLLPKFGEFQDAMTCNSEHAWSLYHSRLSFALNTKMLSPKQVLDAAITAFAQNPQIDIAQIEGFVRQILGWREFVRGIYWANIEHYSESNYLHAKRALPDFFWTGQSKMRCLSACISQSLQTAYAHHIQRLMVTGNFCLLAGIDPDEVDQWYLGIYIDAIEWVEMPNTRGMSQFADGGIIASKPYCGGGNYINKMSDYCKSCHYKVTQKTGELACPITQFYWHFIDRHSDKFAKNPRMAMIYRQWQKRDALEREQILSEAQVRLENLDSL